MPYLFATTLFVGAVLLFAVQPMIGRMLLPAMGGSPAVWNTCLVFFQGSLLLGYLYCHLVSRHLKARLQIPLHLAVLVAAIFVLPIEAPTSRPWTEAPAAWVLVALAVVAGLPFFVVSTTSPLLQRWYAATKARGARDPYFLSIASNTGCLAALIAYPILIEPALPLHAQSEWWRWGYLFYLALMVLCAFSALRNPVSPSALATPAPGVPEAEMGKRHYVRWLILAAVPSSLLVGVTNSITTDIAPIHCFGSCRWRFIC